MFSFLLFMVLLFCDHFTHRYWQRLGFKQMKTVFFFGNIGELCKFKISIAEIFGRLYEATKTQKFIGIYLFYRPFLFVNDPITIQNILVKDFNHFSDHGLYVDEKYDPLSGHLFALKGKEVQMF